ncbi:MAG: RsiV family protein [Roseburia sp.]
MGNEKDYEKLENMKNDYAKMQMTGDQVERMKERMMDAKNEKRQIKKNRAMKSIAAAAAAIAVFVALPNVSADVAYAMSNIPILGKLVDVVTFRDYKYEDERHSADVEVPELVVDKTEMIPGGTESQVQENLQKTTDEINAEIQKLTDQIVSEFEADLAQEEGYQDVIVKHEILNTTEDYFTLKLTHYQGAGSGAQWDYYYTIDLKTGERLALKDLFTEGADYITPISENIKEQMRAQVAADENKMYWLENGEVPEWNFKSITDDTSFYVNENGNIVISFNEGDVAPMYMGVVTFEIPTTVVADIRK